MDLENGEKIYRIISFYELVNTLEKQQLRFARVDTMEDPNEAMTAVLDSELGAAFMGNDFDNGVAHTRLKAVKRSGYINCWTRAPENIAVWSIYSPNTDRVMVRTTIGKLKAALRELDESSLGLKENIFVNKTGVSSVEYVNLTQLKSQWNQKADEFPRIAAGLCQAADLCATPRREH